MEPPEKEGAKGEHFIFASRLVPQKRSDLAIRVFNELKIPLRVVGEGSRYGRLRNMAFLKSESRFHRDALFRNARRFSKERFADEITRFVREKYEEGKRGRPGGFELPPSPR